MTKTKYLKAECGQCRGRIEFPVDAVGMTVDCPHCGKPTELLLAAPPDEPMVPRRTIIWTVATVLILVLGAAAVIVALQLTEKRAARQKEEAAAKALAAAKSEPKPPPEPADPAAKAGFQARSMTLEKTQGSSLTYAVGTLINTTDRQRFGVKIELDLFDDAGKRVGTAKDYVQVIEPHGQWQFKALCVEARARSAKVAAVKEDQ